MSKYAPTIDDVRQFFYSHYHFFTTAISNQTAFAEYFRNHDALDAIQDYSEKFTTLMTKGGKPEQDSQGNLIEQPIFSEHGTYKEPIYNLWTRQTFPDDPRGANWNFEEAFRSPQIRTFLMEQANHPALQVWQIDHPAQAVPLNKTVLSHQERDQHLEKIDAIIDIIQHAQTKLSESVEQFKNIPTPSERTKKIINDLEKAERKLKYLPQNPWGSIYEQKSRLTNAIEDPTCKAIAEGYHAIFKDVSESILACTQEPLLRGWVETFLDAFSRLFGFDGYKSASTKEWERDQNLLDTMFSEVNEALSPSDNSDESNDYRGQVGFFKAVDTQQEVSTNAEHAHSATTSLSTSA